MQVWLGYCDGNSFSGRAAAPYNANGTMLHFNGHAIIDAALDYISTTAIPGAPGLFTSAERVITTGCSAGGLATYLHADYVGAYVAANLPKGTMYGAIAISGFFLQASYEGYSQILSVPYDDARATAMLMRSEKCAFC